MNDDNDDTPSGAVSVRELHHQLLLQQVPAVLWSTDDQLRFTTGSGAGLSALGLEPNQIIGLTLQEYFQTDDPDYPAIVAHRQALEGRSVSYENHFEGRVHSTCLEPLRAEDGSVIGTVGLALDITDQRKLETERQKVQRLESLGMLAGGIAHDFNNLLAAVLTNASLARHRSDPGSQAFRLLTEIEQACDRASVMTRQLLTFSRGGEPRLEPIAIGDLVRDTSEFALRGTGCQPSYDIAEDLWAAKGDRVQLSQVIHNLVLNADEAMPEGGELRISARNHEVRIGNALPLSPGRYVEIGVADEGPGIDPGHLQQIFDPFFTTKTRGSGLGLASSFSIVSRHAGHMTVESMVGEGSRFTFFLPATEEEPETRAPHPSTRPPEVARRILVMDDETAVRSAMRWSLEELGYRVADAAHGDEALDLYRRSVVDGDRFDAVILDLTVPGGLGGLDTLEALLEIDPTVKAVATSGYSSDPVMSGHAEHGFAAVLPKPFRIETLATTVLRVLEGVGGAAQP